MNPTIGGKKASMPVLLDERLWFPDLRGGGCFSPEGLAAVGGDLSVDRLRLAYRSGLFPWTDHPVTWWSPDPRAVIELDGFHVPRSLRRVLRKQPFRITLNSAFERVIRACASQPRPGEWISSDFVAAYTRLHVAGDAHSVECWAGDELAGGVYGVAIGGFFAGESMFHAVENASKVALHYLVEHLRRRRFALFDIQMLTPVTQSLGALAIPRDEYLQRLAEAVAVDTNFQGIPQPRSV